MNLGATARACRLGRQGSTDEIFASLHSMAIRLWSEGYFRFPQFPSGASNNHRLWIAERHLIRVGRLIADGHINDARATAAQLAQTLPSEHFEDESGRI